MDSRINRQYVLNRKYTNDGKAKEIIPPGYLVQAGVDVGGNTEELATDPQSITRIADYKYMEEMQPYPTIGTSYQVGDPLETLVPTVNNVWAVAVSHAGTLAANTKLKLSATPGVLDDAGTIDLNTVVGTLKFQTYKEETFDGGGEIKLIDCFYIGQ